MRIRNTAYRRVLKVSEVYLESQINFVQKFGTQSLMHSVQSDYRYTVPRYSTVLRWHRQTSKWRSFYVIHNWKPCCGSASLRCGSAYFLSLWCGSGSEYRLPNKSSKHWKSAQVGSYSIHWLVICKLLWIRIQIQLITLMRIVPFNSIWCGSGTGSAKLIKKYSAGIVHLTTFSQGIFDLIV